MVDKANIAILLTALEENVELLAQRTSGLQEEQLRALPNKGEWSLTHVIAHLRAYSDLWTYSIYAMLAEENPTLHPIHPQNWQQISTTPGMKFQLEFRIYRYQRDKLVAVLRQQPLKAWKRVATIDNKKHSVYSQVQCMVLHENEHQSQIENIVRTIL